MTWQAFAWRGEPIRDIEAWAHERGEQMVRVRETRRTLNLFAKEIVTTVSETDMPESFFAGLQTAGSDAGGMFYCEEVSRRPPLTEKDTK